MCSFSPEPLRGIRVHSVTMYDAGFSLGTSIWTSHPCPSAYTEDRDSHRYQHVRRWACIPDQCPAFTHMEELPEGLATWLPHPPVHKAHQVLEQIPELLTCQAKVSMTPLPKDIKTSTPVVCGLSPQKRSIANTAVSTGPTPISSPSTRPTGSISQNLALL